MYIENTNTSTLEQIRSILGDNYHKVLLSRKASYKLFNDAIEIIYHKKKYIVIDKSKKKHTLYKNLELAVDHLKTGSHAQPS